VNSRVWNEVSFVLVEVDIERSWKTKRTREARNDLGNDSVEVVVTWSGNIEVSFANVINGFVIEDKCTIGVF